MLGIAATWAAAFAGVGAVFGLGLVLAIASRVLPPSPNGREGLYVAIIVSRAVRWATIGALSGIVFAGTLLVAERRQTLASLSARRFARWGFLAGTLGAAVMAVVVVIFILRDSAPTGSAWSLTAGFAVVPAVGGMLGRAAAVATLRVAHRDLLDLTPPSEHAATGAPLVTGRAT